MLIQHRDEGSLGPISALAGSSYEALGSSNFVEMPGSRSVFILFFHGSERLIDLCFRINAKFIVRNLGKKIASGL
jgi:hypothetical protein